MGRGTKRPSQASAPGQPALDWLASYSRVNRHLAQLGDLNKRLDKGGGLVRIPDLLPPFVADAILALLQHTPGGHWNTTAAQEDYTQNNIAHAFWSTKSAEGLEGVVQALSMLMPGRLHSLSAARYDRGHHIAPHDDRAYTQVSMEDGSVMTCSRDIAIIYYLTKDWTPDLGGALVDIEGGKTYVPQYNSLVAFRVPRYHQVTPLLTDRPRYSIFGWFLEEGIKYDLFKGEDGAGPEVSTAAAEPVRLPQTERAAAAVTEHAQQKRHKKCKQLPASSSQAAAADASRASSQEGLAGTSGEGGAAADGGVPATLTVAPALLAVAPTTFEERRLAALRAHGLKAGRARSRH